MDYSVDDSNNPANFPKGEGEGLYVWKVYPYDGEGWYWVWSGQRGMFFPRYLIPTALGILTVSYDSGQILKWGDTPERWLYQKSRVPTPVPDEMIPDIDEDELEENPWSL